MVESGVRGAVEERRCLPVPFLGEDNLGDDSFSGVVGDVDLDVLEARGGGVIGCGDGFGRRDVADFLGGVSLTGLLGDFVGLLGGFWSFSLCSFFLFFTCIRGDRTTASCSSVKCN